MSGKIGITYNDSNEVKVTEDNFDNDDVLYIEDIPDRTSVDNISPFSNAKLIDNKISYITETNNIHKLLIGSTEYILDSDNSYESENYEILLDGTQKYTMINYIGSNNKQLYYRNHGDWLVYINGTLYSMRYSKFGNFTTDLIDRRRYKIIPEINTTSIPDNKNINNINEVDNIIDIGSNKFIIMPKTKNRMIFIDNNIKLVKEIKYDYKKNNIDGSSIFGYFDENLFFMKDDSKFIYKLNIFTEEINYFNSPFLEKIYVKDTITLNNGRIYILPFNYKHIFYIDANNNNIIEIESVDFTLFYNSLKNFMEVNNKIYIIPDRYNYILFLDTEHNTLVKISPDLSNLDNKIQSIKYNKEEKRITFIIKFQDKVDSSKNGIYYNILYLYIDNNRCEEHSCSNYIWDVIGDELDGNSGGDKFVSSIVVGTDIYCFPFMYEYIVKIDTVTDTWKHIHIGGSFNHNTLNFISNPILIGTDLYCMPFSYNHIVKVDTIADTWEDIGSPFTTSNSFHSTPILVGTDLYCIPYNYNHIVKIDTTTDTWSNIGIDLGTSSNKFRCSVKIGTNIYCIPYYYDYIVKIDTTTDIVTKVGNFLGSTPYKFNTVIVKNDNIYCIPYRYEYIISFNTLNDEWKHIGSERSSDLKYQVSILVNDKIYCVPYQYSHITVVDTTNDSVTDVGESLGDTIHIKFQHAYLVGRYIYCLTSSRSNYFKRFNIDTHEWEDIGNSRGDVNNSEVVSVLINNSIYVLPFAGNKIRKVRLPINKLINPKVDYMNSVFKGLISNYLIPYNDNVILKIKENGSTEIAYSMIYSLYSSNSLFSKVIQISDTKYICVPKTYRVIVVLVVSETLTIMEIPYGIGVSDYKFSDAIVCNDKTILIPNKATKFISIHNDDNTIEESSDLGTLSNELKIRFSSTEYIEEYNKLICFPTYNGTNIYQLNTDTLIFYDYNRTPVNNSNFIGYIKFVTEDSNVLLILFRNGVKIYTIDSNNHNITYDTGDGINISIPQFNEFKEFYVLNINNELHYISNLVYFRVDIDEYKLKDYAIKPSNLKEYNEYIIFNTSNYYDSNNDTGSNLVIINRKTGKSNTYSNYNNPEYILTNNSMIIFSLPNTNSIVIDNKNISENVYISDDITNVPNSIGHYCLYKDNLYFKGNNGDIIKIDTINNTFSVFANNNNIPSFAISIGARNFIYLIRTENDRDIYTIDLDSGIISKIHDFGDNTSTFDSAILIKDIIYCIHSSGNFFKINTNTNTAEEINIGGTFESYVHIDHLIFCFSNDSNNNSVVFDTDNLISRSFNDTSAIAYHAIHNGYIYCIPKSNSYITKININSYTETKLIKINYDVNCTYISNSYGIYIYFMKILKSSMYSHILKKKCIKCTVVILIKDLILYMIMIVI